MNQWDIDKIKSILSEIAFWIALLAVCQIVQCYNLLFLK